MEKQRIKEINDAATLLFLQQGYSKTKIEHIAKAVGVSVGTIYHDFTGKKEIMHFVLKSTIDPEFMDQEFERPIKDTIFKGLNHEIEAAFQKSADDFTKHLKDRADGYSFESLISDTFDLLSKYAVGCLFIEKNYFDFEELADYYRQYRKGFFSAMKQYMDLFIEKGIVRPLEQTELTTNLIIEILTWWAMDMRYISFDAKRVSPEMAKNVCMDNIITAYKL